MIFSKTTSILIFFFFLNLKISFAQTSDWKFIKKVDGISVYHRKSGINNLKDVKIETLFDGNLSSVAESILDVSSFSKWIYKVNYSKILKVYNPNHIEYYNRINMPWPATDRDICVINKVSQNHSSKEVIIEDVANPKALPVNSDFVRIKDFYAKWVLTPTSTGVKGVYIFHSDPAGELPTSIINLLIDEGPINSIKGLKELIKQEKYKKTNSHNIIN